MKIMVLNGSPKGQKSNTLRLAEAFLQGFDPTHSHQIETVVIRDAHIEPCRGCFACWQITPGKCVIQDDMAALIERYLTAELVIWSLPLYYFGMPSGIKAFLDRLLPTNLPQMVMADDGTSGHPARYDLSHQRHVLVSTCGFHTVKGNYDALLRQFEIIFGPRLTTLICPEGELLRVPQLAGRINSYLSQVTKAGAEYAAQGHFSPETQAELDRPLYPPKVFVEMANASWDVSAAATGRQGEGNPADAALGFLRQMAAVYNSQAWDHDIVLEFCFTDLDLTCQLLLQQDGCKLQQSDLLPYTTRIETTLALWQQISTGKVDGAQAMIDGHYRVLGDFDTMLDMGRYFGGEEPPGKVSADQARTNMTLLLLPWIGLWIALPLNAIWGGAVGIVLCAMVLMLGLRYRLTLYDRVSGALVTLLGLTALLTSAGATLVALSYLLFALLWLASTLTPIPLTAYYSNADYGGEVAFANPLFIKTNRILTVAWGALYLALAPFSLWLMQSPLAGWTGLINSLAPALMGLFTAWFVRWYPARVAQGRQKRHP